MAKAGNGYYIVFGSRNFTFVEVDCLVSLGSAAPQAPALTEQITGKIEPVSQSYCTKNSLNYNISRPCQENSIPKSEALLQDYWEDYFCHCCFYFCLCL